MGIRRSKTSGGFTIIEVVLFLAITGLLIATLLAGAGSNIARQRYSDSVESFKSTIQAQYAGLTSTRNERANTFDCNDKTAVISAGGTELRGQSNCYMVGRYMRISGPSITTYSIVAARNTNADSTATTDFARMKTLYNYSTAPSETESKTLEWGAVLSWPKTGSGSRSPSSPRDIGILIIRSPVSGNIYTFTSNNVTPVNAVTSTDLTAMMVSGNAIPGQGPRTLCVDGSGIFTGSNRGVVIDGYAANSAAINTRTNDMLQVAGDSNRC